MLGYTKDTCKQRLVFDLLTVSHLLWAVTVSSPMRKGVWYRAFQVAWIEYSIAPRSCENAGHDVILLYAHWSILNLNVQKVDKQPAE